MSLTGSREKFLAGPSASQACAHSFAGNFSNTGNVRNNHAPARCLNPNIGSHVLCLIACISPTAIVLAIRAIVVNAVDRQPKGALSHVRKKYDVVVPHRIDCNSAPTVQIEILIFRIKAPISHTSPNFIGQRPGCACRFAVRAAPLGSPFFKPASTGRRIASCKSCDTRARKRSAIASAKPLRHGPVPTNVVQNGKATISHASTINKLMTGRMWNAIYNDFSHVQSFLLSVARGRAAFVALFGFANYITARWGRGACN